MRESWHERRVRLAFELAALIGNAFERMSATRDPNWIDRYVDLRFLQARRDDVMGVLDIPRVGGSRRNVSRS